MVIFKSPYPDANVPKDVTIWEWVFESKNFKDLEANPAKPLKAFIDAETKEQLNFADAKIRSSALSTSLIREHGLQPHDTVTVICPNSIWYPVCSLAVFRAGARLNGFPPGSTIDEIAYALKTAKSKFIIVSPSTITKVQQAALSVDIPAANIFLIDGQADGVKTIQELIAQGMTAKFEEPFRLPPGTTNRQICGNLNFSSGTTGLPKAVMISQHNVMAQSVFTTAAYSKMNSKLGMLPMYHLIGSSQFIILPIVANFNIAILPGFSMRGMLQAIADFRIEELNTVPPILLKLARDPLVDEYDLSSLELLICGGAPLSSEILKEVEKRFPSTGFRSGYGATEGGILTNIPETHYDYKYGSSVGTLLPNTTAKVIDAAGNELGPGGIGELLFQGSQVAMGYLDNEKANKETYDVDGWYHSGDIGYFDEEGMLYIIDRLKELIKVKGMQVPPAELEDLLHGHELVADCAVIGIPDEYAGELPKAYVVLADRNMSEGEAAQLIFEYVQEKKANYKWLGEVEFVDAIPKSPAGKLLRQKLRAANKAAESSIEGGAEPGRRVKNQRLVNGTLKNRPSTNGHCAPK